MAGLPPFLPRFLSDEVFARYGARSIDLEIKFECAKYPPGTSKIALQVLEDTLWEELLPMFGRQGVR